MTFAERLNQVINWTAIKQSMKHAIFNNSFPMEMLVVVHTVLQTLFLNIFEECLMFGARHSISLFDKGGKHRQKIDRESGITEMFVY